MKDLRAVPSRSPNVVTRKTGDEYVLVPVTGNIADMNSVFTLNETGAFIWDNIDGKQNLEEIIKKMVTEFNIDSPTAEADMYSFINDLEKYLIIK